MKKSIGFTIVELVVVIAVIGILVGITVVLFTGVQTRARDVSLQSDLKNSAKTVEIWLGKGGNRSIESLLVLYATYGGGYSSWVVGEGADNALTTQLHWNDVPTLPKINVSPGTTLEIIARYGGGADMTAVNDRMRAENLFCIAAAAPHSSYDYRPMSVIHSEYDKMLYYDSAYGKIMTMDELVTLYNAGRNVTCEGHVVRWLATQN